MAVLTADSNRDNHFTKDELSVVLESSLYQEPVFSITTLALDSNPSNNYTWVLSFSKGKATIVFRGTVIDPSKDVEIGANLAATYVNLTAFLATNYLIQKHFKSEYDAVETRIKLTAKEAGPQYDIDLDILPSGTTATQVQGESQLNNLQVGLIIFRKEGNLRKDVIAEYSAPITNGSDSERFFIERALHSQTSFNAPPEDCDAAFLCENHVVDYDLAFFDISGSPPSQSAMDYSGTLRAVRGGSRFENDLLFNNTLANYLIQEQGGALLYLFARKGTIIQEFYTYWYNSGNGDNYSVVANITFNDGTSVNDVMYDFSGTGKEVYGLPLGIPETNIESIVAGEGKTLSDIDKIAYSLITQFTETNVASLGTVIFEDVVFGEKYFMFETSAGGAEVLRFTGQSTEGIEVSKEKYRQLNIPSRYWERRKTGTRTIEHNQIYSISSGMLDSNQLYLYLDILFSELVWEVNYEDGIRFPINIEPGTFSVKSDQRTGKYLYSVSFNYSRAYEEHSGGLQNNFY